MRPSLLIIGLGNPGKQYDLTRHNAGFRAIDLLAKKYGTGEWKESGKFDASVLEARVTMVPVLLVKPLTYMNRSGESIQKLIAFYKLDAAKQILVLSDDIDLPLGTLRFRTSGSAGTHNGLKSIVDIFGEHFPRLRIGIGPKPEGEDLATWVLSKFSKDELQTLDKAIDSVPSKVEEFINTSTHENTPGA